MFFIFKNKSLNQLVILGGMMISLMNCEIEQGDRKAIIRAEVEKRVEEYRQNKMKTCREDLLKLATTKVDSLLIERARMNKNDLEKPEIPDKPDLPEIMNPLDSSPVQPIIKNDGKEIVE